MEEVEFGNWTVSRKGDLQHKTRDYVITADRLNEDDWVLHMMQKGWCDMNEFIPAYYEAMRIAGIKTVTMLTTY